MSAGRQRISSGLSSRRPSSAAVTLRLVEGCRFRVSVKRAADNRLIANAKIRFPWGEIDRHYDTDSNGVVMIEGIRSEELVFQVRADGYALGEKRLEKTQPGTTTDLSFSLGPGGAVEGTVHVLAVVDGRRNVEDELLRRLIRRADTMPGQ